MAALAPRDLADWMFRQVATSAQVVLDAAGLGDSAAAGATAAGLQRVDLDQVGLAAAPGAAARRTQMRLDKGGSPDPMMTAGLGHGAHLLEVGSPVAASLATAGMREWNSAAAAATAANRGDAGLDGAGSAAAAAAAANRGDAGLDEAGSAAAAAAAANRGHAGLDEAGSAAAAAAAANRGDAGLDDAGSAVLTAVDRGKEGVQVEVVAPRPQMLVVEPLIWAECAPPTDTGRMARTGDDRHRRPACVGTYGRTAADRAGAPFLRSDAAREEPCCRNGRSSHSPTPRGQGAKGGRFCTERPPKR